MGDRAGISGVACGIAAPRGRLPQAALVGILIAVTPELASSAAVGQHLPFGLLGAAAIILVLTAGSDESVAGASLDPIAATAVAAILLLAAAALTVLLGRFVTPPTRSSRSHRSTGLRAPTRFR